MATRKRPTPIRKTEPDIIEFPKPQQDPNYLALEDFLEPLPQPMPETMALKSNPIPLGFDDVRLKAFIREEVAKALDGYSANLYHALDRSEAEIIEMGEAQFQALMRDVWRSE